MSRLKLIERRMSRFLSEPVSVRNAAAVIALSTTLVVIASGVLGQHPSPAAVQQRLEATARDLGPTGYDRRYGWGLIDAAAATAPGGPRVPTGSRAS